MIGSKAFTIVVLNQLGNVLRCVCGCITAEYFQIHTDAVYDFDRVLLTTHRKAFSFHVQACKEAHVALSSQPSQGAPSWDMLELIIGTDDNQKTVFTSDGTEVKSIDTPNILSCTDYRLFWVALDKGEMQFGRGRPYEEVMMVHSWAEDLCCAALSTWQGVQGEWLVFKDTGQSITYVQSPANMHGELMLN